ncbi:bifunctional YncE family protein/alkaline phosphatase family protein [Mucilaginibacter sp. UR6-11]|uniref:bifunctional YncE family protein/alkaline phosphatase family protein n=1 Tax=Mucilaginibacter sp. UR6-11 TaxID=1435644 RepID=UPI001E4532C9|nr:bifunctional YncE family protein/alkaline phosphatase family protein [Mucilaginibacter sp. UR6-11]MCC8423699.1 bifunctional YncE family protein/alkaline phosphatase family protein [Mucilaginibacter sp. UR6-11]
MEKMIFKLKLLCTAALIFVFWNAHAQVPGKIAHTNQVLLPNGWKLSPAGRQLPLGDLPLNMQLSLSGKLLAVTNNGQSNQSIQLVDPGSEKILDEKVLKKSWYGLAFSHDEAHLYVSGGYDNWLLDFPVRHNQLGVADTIRLGLPWPRKAICPTGLVTNKSNSRLYAVTKGDSCLYVVEPATRKVVSKLQLPTIAYDCLLSPDERTLYISLWGGTGVAVYNTLTGAITATIYSGHHPNELLLNKNGSRLFVANANDNTVSIIDTKTNKLTETISTVLYPTKLAGSTTNGVALSADEKILYIANADNNCLAVFDVSKPGNSQSLGFIPTGWYPTNVKTLGNKIIVANGKGLTSKANPLGPQPFLKDNNIGEHVGQTANSRIQYIGGLFDGALSFIDRPKPEQQKAYTKQVYANTPFTPKRTVQADGETGSPIPRKLGEKSPIKYVFYIIKENRTYDQVMGDVPEGDGDTSLCIFGKNITPNQHALAKEFVLLDNFYVDAEVSEDGHNWSMGAYATDIIEKTWPTNYSSRGPAYSGSASGANDGYIWDYCKRAGVTYRSYGEFGSYNKASIKSLQGHMSPHSPGFNTKIMDQVRANAWIHDFDSLLTINAVPQLSTLRISEDHTSGQKRGEYSPIASVADNDLAVGRIVEHLSQSPIWKESVVFILEDDAQAGPDHIDAHRSPAYVIGPYVKRDAVVHSMYSTSGMLRTIELILGLPPMSQYDAAALPFYECFTNKPVLTPYQLKPAQVSIDSRNVAFNESSKRSEFFNLANEDKVPDRDMNEVIWKAVKGENAVMPAPKRSAFVILEKKKKDDDD